MYEPSIPEYLNWDNDSLRNCLVPCPCRTFSPRQPGREIVNYDARSWMAKNFQISDVFPYRVIIVPAVNKNYVE